MSDLNQNESNGSEQVNEEKEIINENEITDSSTTDETTATADPSNQPSSGIAEAAPKRSWVVESVDYIEIFVFAIGFVILLFSFVFRLCTVDGGSMENTLYENEALMVSDLFYEPERGDVIVFHQTGVLNEPVVKRVIAVEGETVSIQHTQETMTITVTQADGTVRVLEEGYMKYEGRPLYRGTMTVTVPEGHLFVLGDNRNESKDSRHPDIFLVDERRVLGKVIFRLTPFSRFGVVE